MKVTIERAALLKGLSHAQSVVERRNTIPILANIRLTAEGDRLLLTATDMDLSIVEEVEVALTILKLTGTDRDDQEFLRPGKHRYV